MNETMEFGPTDYNIIFAIYQRFDYILVTLALFSRSQAAENCQFRANKDLSAPASSKNW